MLRRIKKRTRHAFYMRAGSYQHRGQQNHPTTTLPLNKNTQREWKKIRLSFGHQIIGLSNGNKIKL